MLGAFQGQNISTNWGFVPPGNGALELGSCRITLSSLVRMTEMLPLLFATKTLAPSVDEPIDTIEAAAPAVMASGKSGGLWEGKVFTVLLLVRMTETVPSELAT